MKKEKPRKKRKYVRRQQPVEKRFITFDHGGTIHTDAHPLEKLLSSMSPGRSIYVEFPADVVSKVADIINIRVQVATMYVMGLGVAGVEQVTKIVRLA